MTVSLAPAPVFQGVGFGGLPLPGGKLFTYVAGTSTPQATYTDSTQLTQNTNPTILNANGQANVWLVINQTYKLVLQDFFGNQIWSVDNIPGGISLNLTQQTLGQILYPQTPAEIAVGVTPLNYAYPAGNVLRYGAKGDGINDDTGAIQNTVLVCRQGGYQAFFPQATYIVSSSIVLASGTLAPVNVSGSSPQWISDSSCTIQGNFNGAIFECSGTISTISTAPSIQNLTIVNSSTGTVACAIHGAYSGGLRVYECWTRTYNFGIYSEANMISAVFREVTQDAYTSPPGGFGVAGYKISGNNLYIDGGRSYTQQIAIDATGQSIVAVAHNSEFCQVYFRHQALSSAVFIDCHIEGAQVLLTNATTIPFATGVNWVDNGSAGTGITGFVAFYGGVCNGMAQFSNLVVIKTQGGFTYRLHMEGLALASVNQIVGNSFTPGANVALPSGTKVRITDCDGLTVNVPPVDAFSGYETENPGGTRNFSSLTAVVLVSGIKSAGTAAASGGTFGVATGDGQFNAAVYDVSWRASSASYEYTAIQRCVQSFNFMTLGTRESALGGGSADADWTLAWTAATGTFVLTNNTGILKNLTVLVNKVSQVQ